MFKTIFLQSFKNLQQLKLSLRNRGALSYIFLYSFIFSSTEANVRMSCDDENGFPSRSSSTFQASQQCLAMQNVSVTREALLCS